MKYRGWYIQEHPAGWTLFDPFDEWSDNHFIPEECGMLYVYDFIDAYQDKRETH